MPELSNHPECDRCVRAPHDGYWCDTHGSPIGDSYDGWAGCTKAIVADVRAYVDAFEKADEAAFAAVEDNYPEFERLQLAAVEPGLALSSFLLGLGEPRPADWVAAG